MSRTHFVVLSCLCLGLVLLSGPALAAEAEVVEEGPACLTLFEPMVEMQDDPDGEFPYDPDVECDADDEACCTEFPDSDACMANVWCCKPNSSGTSQHCAKISAAKCAAAPAGVVHPSGPACARAC